MRILVACALCLGFFGPLMAQPLSERLNASYDLWEGALKQGDGVSVQQQVKVLLQREAPPLSLADYNEVQASVTLLGILARAHIVEGEWEKAIECLQQAASRAADNVVNAEKTFGPIRKEHDVKLAMWRADLARQEAALKELESAPGLTEDQMQRQRQLRLVVDEHRNAISHSEWSTKEIANLFVKLNREKESYAASLAAWQTFLAQEQQEVAKVGSPVTYAADKLLQVKNDDARPRFERLAYGRRLVRLDPDNRDCAAFVEALQGVEKPVEPEPAPSPKKKKGKAKK